MIRIGPITIALTGWVIFCVSFVLLPTAAQAACSWDLNGAWYARQDNGQVVLFNITQTGTDVRGTASYGFNGISNGVPVKKIYGTVVGWVKQNNFHVQVSWRRFRGSVGVTTTVRWTAMAC